MDSFLFFFLRGLSYFYFLFLAGAKHLTSYSIHVVFAETEGGETAYYEVKEDLNTNPEENLNNFIAILTESLFVLKKLPDAVEVSLLAFILPARNNVGNYCSKPRLMNILLPFFRKEGSVFYVSGYACLNGWSSFPS